MQRFLQQLTHPQSFAPAASAVAENLSKTRTKRGGGEGGGERGGREGGTEGETHTETERQSGEGRTNATFRAGLKVASQGSGASFAFLQRVHYRTPALLREGSQPALVWGDVSVGGDF